MRIACLHTADSNVAVFNEAANSLRCDSQQLSHVVRSDLLAAAEDSGGLSKINAQIDTATPFQH